MNTSAQPLMTVFMLVKTLPAWLSLPPETRLAEVDAYLKPIVARFGEQVRLRFYDVEFYTARATDIWVWDVYDQHAYELLVEALRETPFWDRYFAILDILPGVENAYANSYQPTPLAA